MPGFKNPKHIIAITITNDLSGGFGKKRRYNSLNGL
jgi:hypothetical protein